MTAITVAVALGGQQRSDPKLACFRNAAAILVVAYNDLDTTTRIVPHTNLYYD